MQQKLTKSFSTMTDKELFEYKRSLRKEALRRMDKSGRVIDLKTREIISEGEDGLPAKTWASSWHLW